MEHSIISKCCLPKLGNCGPLRHVKQKALIQILVDGNFIGKQLVKSQLMKYRLPLAPSMTAPMILNP